MKQPDAIVLDNLTVRYGARVGIEGVHLTVPSAGIYGFLGPNGAGKTTAIRVLLGFLRPDGGAAHMLGINCWHKSHVLKRAVGYVPGDLRLYPWMTVPGALRLLGRIRGLDVMPSGLRLAERFGLDQTVAAQRMSRGMRQKLGLILALASNPKVLVLDEPTSGLDPISQWELARILRERVEADGTTVFFSSHTLSEVEHLCERVAIVRAGRIVCDSTIADLQTRARRRVEIQLDPSSNRTISTIPERIDILERGTERWIAEFSGSARVVARWLLAESAVVDFTIGPPDLEAVFHGYYHTDRETERGDGA